MLQVMEKESKFATDLSKGVVIVRSNLKDFQKAIIELSEGRAARDTAIAFAARCGMSKPTITGFVPHPYAVNNEGVPLYQIHDGKGQPLSPRDPRMQPAFYQVEASVTQGV